MAGKVISNIVKSELIFYSDVPNIRCYPGGSACYSLTTGSEGSLDNGVSITGGTYDKSFNFDGIDDLVNIQSSAYIKIPTLPLTLDFWVYVDSACPDFAGIFSTAWSSSNYNGISLQIDMSGGIYSLGCSYGDGTGSNSWNRRSFSTSIEFEVDKWYHVTICIESSTSSNFYKNAVPIIVDSVSGGHMGPMVWPSNLPLYLGRAWNSGGAFFKGNVANLKIYDKALSIDEVQQNFNAHRKRYNL